MVSATAAVVSPDGHLHRDRDLPDALAVELGLLLGMSPVVHVEPGVLVDEHAAVLCEAAHVLGYEGAALAAVTEELRVMLASGSGSSAVALVPTAAHHRATPPGRAWRLQVLAPCDTEPASPVDLVVSPFARRALPEVASLVLQADAEHEAAAALHPGGAVDPAALVRVDGAGHVARVGDSAVFARIARRIVTPRLADGAPRTAWRAALLDGVHETTLTLDELAGATSIVCLSPAGAVRPVRSIDGLVHHDESLADELDERLASLRLHTGEHP
jgi:branched-subunit amino acid aminotransferase/4-amino-4-deoxychorismate lyase